jgi:hypothetical protein
MQAILRTGIEVMAFGLNHADLHMRKEEPTYGRQA